MSLTPLANAELSIMELLWNHERLTARKIQDQLYGESDRSQHGTVQRLLQRLEDKGYVQRERGSGAQEFVPLVSREDYASSLLESLAERLTGGSIAPLLTHLIEQKRLSRSEIRRLRELLNRGKP